MIAARAIRTSPINAVQQLAVLGLLPLSVIALLLSLNRHGVDQGLALRMAARSPYDTIVTPRGRLTFSQVTFSLGGLVSGGGFVLQLIDRLHPPDIILSATIRIDTLPVPSAQAQDSLVPSFSEPWVRGSISIRNSGSKAASGVMLVSPVTVGRQWPHSVARVGATLPSTFAGKNLVIGSLPPGAWADIALWWHFQQDAPPLAAFVVLHDAGTVRPSVPEKEPRGLLNPLIVIGIGILMLGSLTLSLPSVLRRFRFRRR